MTQTYMTQFDHPTYSLIRSKGIKSLYALHGSCYHLIHYYNMTDKLQVNHIEVVDEDHLEDYLYFTAHPEHDGQTLKIIPCQAQYLQPEITPRLLGVICDILQVEPTIRLNIVPRLSLLPQEKEHFFRENAALIALTEQINFAHGHSHSHSNGNGHDPAPDNNDAPKP